jgi:hypothetical protein
MNKYSLTLLAALLAAGTAAAQTGVGGSAGGSTGSSSGAGSSTLGAPTVPPEPGAVPGDPRVTGGGTRGPTPGTLATPDNPSGLNQPGTLSGSATLNPGAILSPSNPGSVVGSAPGMPQQDPGAVGRIQQEGATRAQAEARQRTALQQCSAMGGAAQNDCVRRATDDFNRSVRR